MDNAAEIARSIDAELIIYDHHLPRDRKIGEMTKKVWNVAKKEDKKLLTVAEFLKVPVVLSAAWSTSSEG